MFLEPSANMDAMDCLFSSLAGAASASFSAAGGEERAFVAAAAAAAAPSATSAGVGIMPGLDVVAGDAIFSCFCESGIYFQSSLASGDALREWTSGE